MWRYEQAVQALKPGKLAPVYVLHGSEYSLIRSFVDQLTHAMEQAYGAVDQHRFDFEEDGVEGAIGACCAVGLFASHALVWLRGVTPLSTANSRVKHDTVALERYLEEPIPDHVLVLTVDADKLDERKRLVKLAQRHTVVHCSTPGESDALRWLQRYAEARGVQVTRMALQEVWRRTGQISRAETELDKLAVWCDGRPVEVEDVDMLITPPPEDDVFAWLDDVVSGRVDRAFRTLRDLTTGGRDPVGLLALLQRQIRLMAWTKVGAERGWTTKQLASRVAAHPFAVQEASRQARSLSLRQLEDWMLWACDADYAVKSGRRDGRHALELWMAKATGVMHAQVGHRKR